MNNGQRKAVRDHLKTLIGTVPGAEVFAFKKAKIETDTPAICVYFEQGEHGGLEDNGTLTLRIIAPDQADIDDVLDDIADVAQSRIEAGAVADAPYAFIFEQGFEYDRDSTEAWTALDIRYTVNY